MKFVYVILLGLSTLSLSACNTMSGVGKDVKAGGSAIERSAEEKK